MAEKSALQLTREEYAQRAGVDVSRIQGEFGNFIVGPEPMVSSPTPVVQPEQSPQSLTQSQGDLFKVATRGVGPDGKPIYDVFAGQEHIADPSDPRLKGIDIAGLPTGQAPTGFKSKFETGFDSANKALGNAAGDIRDGSIVNQYSPARTNDFSSLFVQQDPFLGGLVRTFQDYISPANQRTSLREEYSKMLKDTGIQQIDLELVDMKNIIEGTEDDLRTEITKAGGFATESQIQALTNARNKQLIKNYNTLLDTRNAKEKYLTTMIGLEQADREAADQRFGQMFNMGLQIAQYQQQMQQNARNQMQWLASNVGFDGLYDSTGGNPYYMSLIESTLGLPRGGLLSFANQARLAQARAEQERQLQLQESRLGIALKEEQLKMTPLERALKEEQIKTEQAQRAKIYSDISGNTKKPPTQEQLKVAGFRDRLIESNQIINQLGSQFTSPYSGLLGFLPNFLKSEDRQEYEQAQRNFINAVLRRESGAVISDEEFDNARQQYFPQPGDQYGVLQQKAANRLTVLNSFSRESGSTPLNTNSNDPLGLF